MNQIKAYKLSDGRIVEDEFEAVKLEEEIIRKEKNTKFKEAVEEFIDKNIANNGYFITTLSEVITDYADELERLLKIRK
jgi:DNA polymerase III epsilon subunit-like protein